MLPCFSARTRRGSCSFTVTLLAFALMLGAGAETLRADPIDLTQGLRGGVDSAGDVKVENPDGDIDIADLIDQLPDDPVDAREVLAEPTASGEVVRLALPAPEVSADLRVSELRRHRLDTSQAGPAPSETQVIGIGDGLLAGLTISDLVGAYPLGTMSGNDGDIQPGDTYARFGPAPNALLTGLSNWRRPETNYNRLGFDPVGEPDQLHLLNQLSGEWNHGAWRFTPSVGYERQNVNGDKTRMLYFGPAVGYRHQQPDGTVIEPHLGVKGRWDLDPLLGLDREVLSPSLDAKLEGGVRLQDFTGWSLDANASVGGVGDPKSAVDWRGNLGVTVPLN